MLSQVATTFRWRNSNGFDDHGNLPSFLARALYYGEGAEGPDEPVPDSVPTEVQIYRFHQAVVQQVA